MWSSCDDVVVPNPSASVQLNSDNTSLYLDGFFIFSTFPENSLVTAIPRSMKGDLSTHQSQLIISNLSKVFTYEQFFLFVDKIILNSFHEMMFQSNLYGTV